MFCKYVLIIKTNSTLYSGHSGILEQPIIETTISARTLKKYGGRISGCKIINQKFIQDVYCATLYTL